MIQSCEIEKGLECCQDADIEYQNNPVDERAKGMLQLQICPYQDRKYSVW